MSGRFEWPSTPHPRSEHLRDHPAISKQIAKQGASSGGPLLLLLFALLGAEACRRAEVYLGNEDAGPDAGGKSAEDVGQAEPGAARVEESAFPRLMIAGTEAVVWVRVTNLGPEPWLPTLPLELRSTGSALSATTSVPLMLEAAPQAEQRVEWRIRAPEQPGAYRHRWSLHGPTGHQLVELDLPVWVIGCGATMISKNVHGRPANFGVANLAPSLSGDGSRVTFLSGSTNLTEPLFEGRQAFRFDGAEGELRLTSTSSLGVPPNRGLSSAVTDLTGDFLVFSTPATNLAPLPEFSRTVEDQLYVRNLKTGVVHWLGVMAAEEGIADCRVAAWSADRAVLAFTASPPGGWPQAMIWEEGGALQVVSTPTVGRSNERSAAQDLSEDGNLVLFASNATNLVSGVRPGRHLYLVDRRTQEITLIDRDSLGGAGNGDVGGASMSGDGAFIAFESTASNLDPGWDQSGAQVFLWDRTTGRSEVISLDPSRSLQRPARNPRLSKDAAFVVFERDSDQEPAQIYVRNLITGSVRLVSRTASGQPGAGHSSQAAISPDGRVIGFVSYATNFAGPPSSEAQLFVAANPFLCPTEP